MLADEDKTRIREEEIFRDEVRKDLSRHEKDTLVERTWKVLNSSICIWLLSTVVVGLIVQSYGSFQNKQEARRIEERLRLEIESRVRNFNRRIDSASSPDARDSLAAALAELENATGTKNAFRVFDEYKDRSLESLLLELERLVGSRRDRIVPDSGTPGDFSSIELAIGAARDITVMRHELPKDLSEQEIARAKEFLIEWTLKCFGVDRYTRPYVTPYKSDNPLNEAIRKP
jgi:hypothetical protein